MKYLKYTILLILFGLLYNCDTAENVVELPTSQFDYVSFETSTINVNEADSGPVTTTFIYSSATLLSEDLTVNYTMSFPDDNAAQNGVDFVLPSNSGSFVLPAGQATVEVVLFESLINDDLSVGTRSVTFDLEPIGDFILGRPDGERKAKSIEVTIVEDDLFEFGYTSFEEVPTFDTRTRYPRPAGSVNPLPNMQDTDANSDIPYVSYVSTGDELGFSAAFVASDVDDIENEVMGVYNNMVAQDNPDDFETTFIDGNQGYVSSDLDGTLRITFDEITELNPDVTSAVLNIKFFFASTTWESEDGIVVFYETDEDLGAPLLSIFSDDAEEMAGTWQELSIPIPADRLVAGGRLVVTMTNGSGAETIMLDYISIKGIL